MSSLTWKRMWRRNPRGSKAWLRRTAIPVNNVDGETLARVIDWCKKTLQHRQDDQEDDKAKGVTNWKYKFYKIDLTAFYDLLQAANYLGVTDLLDETCERVAGFISRKTPDEVRRIFNMENDLTKEELEEIDKAREWA